jgi:hypothetical protein
MTPFLDCNIWSVTFDGIDQYFFVEKVYHYKSSTQEFIDIIPGHIQIPEFEISNLSLLQQVNFNVVNEHHIPIIKINENGSWSIDLKYYEKYHSNL